MKQALISAYNKTKLFFKKTWVLMVSGGVLISVCIGTAIVFPAFFPMMANKIVDASNWMCAKIAGFFGRFTNTPGVPVPADPVVVVVEPAFA